MDRLKVLLFDLEIISRSFGLPKKTMSADKSYVSCFGYKWDHEKKAKCINIGQWRSDYKKDAYNEKNVVLKMHEIMSKADVIVGHYSDKFDAPYVRTKFLMYGLQPLPRLIVQRDTCKIAWQKLKFSSNRLGVIAEALGCEYQKEHLPEEVWFDVIRSKPYAILLQSQYCINDVNTLDSVYQRVKHLFPPIRHMLGQACPECNSARIESKGIRATQSYQYRRVRCIDCGSSWKGDRIL
jgi:hypothetical protein